jgi:hypothetical protein
MITKQQADYLIGLPKHVIEQVTRGEQTFLDQKRYTPSLPINDRIFMASKIDDEFTFFVDIFQSSKNQLRINLHLQEEDSNIGLLRVDFNGGHHNPAVANENIPDPFRQYADMWIEGSHIHYFFDGYKPLSWAIPIIIDKTFPIKEFTDTSQIGSVIHAFCNKINLATELTITFQKDIHELD